MLLLKALRNRPIALLWMGQAASAIGDEIYRVALVWLAVSAIGEKAGYLAAAQAGTLLVFSLVGGVWSDAWNPFRTLLRVDFLRALIVLIPVILFSKLQSPAFMILLVAMSLSALSSFFDPALQSLLPRVANTPQMLQAATGLMATTLRLARVLGPGLIGVLSSFLPMIHFFSLDAVTFLLSMLSIFSLRRLLAPIEARPQAATFRESVSAGFHLVTRSREMIQMMISKCICGGTWNLAYGLGVVLLVRHIAGGEVRAYGWVLSSYGIGNIVSVVVLGNLPRVRLTRLVYLGYLVLGAGFFLMAVSPNLKWLMMAAAFTAIGGPLNDVPFIDLIQSRYSVDEIPKVFRFRMALDTGATLIGMLFAPTLFHVHSIQSVVGACGLLTFGVGLLGLVLR